MDAQGGGKIRVSCTVLAMAKVCQFQKKSLRLINICTFLPSDIQNETIQCPGRFWAEIGQDPNASKSNPLHVDIFQFPFIKVKYILQIPLK